MNLTRLLPSSVGVRLVAPLAALGIVALAGAVMTFLETKAHDAEVMALSRTQASIPLMERLRGSAYAVVMESRGLYIARDAGQAEGFVKGLRGHLADMESTWTALRPIVPVEAVTAADRLEQPLRNFVALRAELARVSLDQGAEAADKLGNNAANRAARIAFTNALDALPPLTSAAIERQRSEIMAGGRRLSLWLLVATILAVAITSGLALWLVRASVVRPLRQLATALRTMADGRLDDVALPPQGPGEVGSIAGAAAVFRDALQRNQVLEAASAAEAGARDRRQAAINRITVDFGTTVSGVLAKLGNSAGDMRVSAAGMADASQRTHGELAGTVDDAESSSRSLGGVASATGQLTASVSEISAQVAQAARSAQLAATQARETDTKVQELSAASGQIGDVVRLINALAAQTNLLALNATIEAARAGEAGKGFAVVAGEVKGLAAQTASATSRIAEQVTAIQTATGEAVTAVRDVAAAISEVSEVATAIAAAVEEQGAATRQIAEQVQDVAEATNKATCAMRGAATMAEASGATSQVVLSTADELASLSGTLQEEVEEFFAALKLSEQGGDRRRYERVPGRSSVAHLQCATYGSGSGTIIDIALGGAKIACEWPCDVGAEVLVGLPGGTGFVSARIVDSRAGILAVAFRQNAPSVARVTAALQAIAALPSAALAA